MKNKKDVVVGAITIVVMLVVFALLGMVIERRLHDRGTIRREAVALPAPYSAVVLGGCEYITFPTGGGFKGLVHKGNCTNVVHQQ